MLLISRKQKIKNTGKILKRICIDLKIYFYINEKFVKIQQNR